MGDWENTQKFFREDEDALTAELDDSGYRAVHLAVGNPENIWFLEKLLEQIDPEKLPTLVTVTDQNVLDYAAMLDNDQAAKKLVERNPNLLFSASSISLPIESAIINSNRTTYLYLLQACKQYIGLSEKNGQQHPFVGEDGSSILKLTIEEGFMDVAYDLLKDYPQLASTDANSSWNPIWCMAQTRDAYPSAKRYNFYQMFGYSRIPSENYNLGDTNKIRDIENQETYRVNLFTRKSYIYSVIRRIYARFWKVAILHVPHIKRLHEDKVKHNTTLTKLKFLCEKAGKL